MKTFNGGSISNVLINLHYQDLGIWAKSIWITDTQDRAIRYANAQATECVNESYNQELVEGAIIFEIECNPNFTRRDENHNTLDVCEDQISDYRICKATIKFHANPQTKYGNRHSGYKNAEQVVEFLQQQKIAIEIS